jgi:hypothetical protein
MKGGKCKGNTMIKTTGDKTERKTKARARRKKCTQVISRKDKHR